MRAFGYAWSLPVTWQGWRSHHSIRCCRKPYVTCKFHDAMFYRTGVMATRSFTVREYAFSISSSCDLDLDPITFIYELDPYSLKIYRTCKYELSIRQGFRYRPKLYTTPLGGCMVKNSNVSKQHLRQCLRCCNIISTTHTQRRIN